MKLFVTGRKVKAYGREWALLDHIQDEAYTAIEVGVEGPSPVMAIVVKEEKNEETAKFEMSLQKGKT